MPIRWLFLLGAVAALCGIAELVYASTAPAIALSMGTAVRHDDFTFTVVDAHREAGDDNADPTLRVRLSVSNEARRVAFTFNPAIAYVSDANGRRYAADYARSTSQRIEPGETAIQTLVYHIPANARNLTLGYWDGVLMGDVFDGLHYARVRISL